MRAVDANKPIEIPFPPRPLTARARRRSWAEAPVRRAAVATALVGAITLGFTADRVVVARRDRRLIASGTPINATIIEINGQKSRGRPFPRGERVDVLLAYTPPDGTKRYKLTTFEPVPGHPDATIMIDQAVPIHVDPDDGDLWTEREVPRPWVQELAMSLLLTPVVLLAALWTFARRAAVLKLWKTGRAARGTVIGVAHSSIAPRSRLVRLRTDESRRILSILVPAANVAVDDQLELIIDAASASDLAVAARLYAGD